MTSFLTVFAIIISLFGCSSVKLNIDNGYLTHEDLYRAPILNNESWVRFIPAGHYDVMYLRCPSEQRIGILYEMLCGKYDYSQMTEDDYPKRIYLNSYFSSLGFCPGPGISRLTDRNFKKMTGPPIVNKDKKQFTIVYETTSNQHLCSSSTNTIPIKSMDVFIEEQKYHFQGALHTRFVIFRYMSPEDQYENGINEFQEIVSKFQWLE